VHAIYRDASGLLANRLSDSRSSNGSSRTVGKQLKDFVGQPVRLLDRGSLKAYLSLLEREINVVRAALATLEANEGSLAGGAGHHGGQTLSAIERQGGGDSADRGERSTNMRSSATPGNMYRTVSTAALATPTSGNRRVAPTPSNAGSSGGASGSGNTGAGIYLPGSTSATTPNSVSNNGPQTRFVAPATMTRAAGGSTGSNAPSTAFVSTAKPSVANAVTVSPSTGNSRLQSATSANNNNSNNNTTASVARYTATMASPPASSPLSINTGNVSSSGNDEAAPLVGSALGPLVGHAGSSSAPSSANSSPTAASAHYTDRSTPSQMMRTIHSSNIINNSSGNSNNNEGALHRLVISVDERERANSSTDSHSNATDSPLTGSIAMTTLPAAASSSSTASMAPPTVYTASGHGISSRASGATALRSHVSVSAGDLERPPS
jgi:hypothetical protein